MNIYKNISQAIENCIIIEMSYNKYVAIYRRSNCKSKMVASTRR